jgi:copper-binding protein NosD
MSNLCVTFLALAGLLTDYPPDLSVEGLMKMFRASLVVSVFLFSGIAEAATTTVTATGNCPADPTAVQSAINSAAPGDTIQLLPGPSGLAFNFTCGGGLTVQTLALTLEGTPGATVINGPGSTTGQVGLLIFSDDVTVTGIGFQNFGLGIVGTNADFSSAEPGPANLTITKSSFANNGFGVLVLGVCDHFRFTNNVVQVPGPPTTIFGSNLGIVIQTSDNDLLVADNTLTGPGPTGLLTSISQLPNPPSPVLQTFGILQVDFLMPAAVRGRISGNIVSRLDVGLQSSSNFGVVTGNTASNCAIGLIISNDTDDGVTQVTDNIVAQNISSGNEIGLWVASGARNSVLLNDLSNSSLVGLLFLQNPNGAPSQDNVFLLNKGSMRGVPGNQGAGVCKALNLCK